MILSRLQLNFFDISLILILFNTKSSISSIFEKNFSLNSVSPDMFLGVIFGTYSSIYIANPILVKLRVSQKTILKEDTE